MYNVIPYNPHVHRVSAATNKLDIAKAVHAANPKNITYALDVQIAQREREAAILALRSTFKLVWVNPNASE